MAQKFPLFILLLFFGNSVFSQTDSTNNPAVNYVLSITNKVEKENRLAGSLNPDSVSSLPIGIVKEIGITLVLKPDGHNYVDWDCNGFHSVNLKGYFEFSPGLIYPDSSSSHDQTVKATFEINTTDVHNFITQINFTPFCIRGLKDVSFSVTDATVDMSELANAPNMNFPIGYINTFAPDIQMWRGFYMKQFKIKFPPELAKGNTRTEIFANNFIIDQGGVSGSFQATNVLSMGDGSMSGWSFSITQLGLNLVCNHVNGGNISGKLRLPVCDTNSIAFNAAVLENTYTKQLDYSFSISPATNLSAPVLSAQVDLYPTSRIIISKTSGQFVPSAELNGKITFSHQNIKVSHLDFQHLVLTTDSPYLVSGIFAFVSNTPTDHAGNFPISINNIAIAISPTAPAIGIKVGLNFMSAQDQGFSAETKFNIVAKIQQEQIGMNGNIPVYKQHWDLDGIRVDDIGLGIHTGAFDLTGVIKFKDNDPVYGKGFYGQLGVRVSDVIPGTINASAWFGKVNDLKYWYVDAVVPTKISLGGSGLALYRIMGGLYYHMHQQGNNLTTNLYTPAFTNGQNYVPDANTSLGFKAGVTVGTSGSEKPFNGDVVFEVNFNSGSNGGGISDIKMTGDVYSMTTIADRANKPISTQKIYGNMLLNYDFNNKAFHAVINAAINMPEASGGGQAVIHDEPGIWYVCIGKPSNRAHVSIANIGNINAYFMVGNQLEPMPPPPPLVTSLISISGLDHLRDESKLTNAQGLVFGASIQTSAGNQFDIGGIEIYGSYSLTVGFDMMLIDHGPNAHCSNSPTVIGINGWHASGQVYAAMQGNVGVRGHVKFLPGCDKACIIDADFDITILSGSVAALLYAQVPKPNYLAGAVACEYDILGAIHGTCNFDFSLGNQCTIVD